MADRTIPRETIAEMVRLADPEATLTAATLAPEGHLPVYDLDVETAAGPREWVVKATPVAGTSGIATEARLMAMLAEYTSIPVPGVIGVVDEHDALPTPYLVMERAPGERLPKRAVGDLSDATLGRIARESGCYLAEVHQLKRPPGFGHLAVVAGVAAVGRPRALRRRRRTPPPGRGCYARGRGTSSRIFATPGSSRWPTRSRRCSRG